MSKFRNMAQQGVKAAAPGLAGFGAGYTRSKFGAPEIHSTAKAKKVKLGIAGASAYLSLTPAGQRKTVKRAVKAAGFGAAYHSGRAYGSKKRVKAK